MQFIASALGPRNGFPGRSTLLQVAEIGAFTPGRPSSRHYAARRRRTHTRDGEQGWHAEKDTPTSFKSLVENVRVRAGAGKLQFVAFDPIQQQPIRLNMKVAKSFPIAF